jgi:hypothetical protein
MPLGGNRFKEQVETALNRKLGYSDRGRPVQLNISPNTNHCQLSPTPLFSALIVSDTFSGSSDIKRALFCHILMNSLMNRLTDSLMGHESMAIFGILSV